MAVRQSCAGLFVPPSDQKRATFARARTCAFAPTRVSGSPISASVAASRTATSDGGLPRDHGLVATPAMIAFLNERGAPLIRSAYDDVTGRELYRAVGGLVALAGVCAYDANLQGVAQRYFFQALRMAKASGDRGSGGYVVACWPIGLSISAGTGAGPARRCLHQGRRSGRLWPPPALRSENPPGPARPAVRALDSQNIFTRLSNPPSTSSSATTRTGAAPRLYRASRTASSAVATELCAYGCDSGNTRS